MNQAPQMIGNQELLDAFGEYLDAVLHMDIRATIAAVANVPDTPTGKLILRYQTKAAKALGVLLRRMGPQYSRTQETILNIVRSFANSNSLVEITRDDLAFYPPRSLERDGLKIFYDFVQMYRRERKR